MTENEILEGEPYKALLHYYGEERLDWEIRSPEKYSLIVYWDKVTVRNENEDTIEITDLYARISIVGGKLCGTPEMLRTSYSRQQWDAGYAHSHLPHNSLSWAHPCLGRGALRGTVTTLAGKGGDYHMWFLFALELDRYVHIESLKGGPYIRMSDVLSGREKTETDYSFDTSWIGTEVLGDNLKSLDVYKIFVREMPELDLAVSDFDIRPACTYVEFTVMVTNILVNLYNRDKEKYAWARNLLVKGRVVDVAHIAYCVNGRVMRSYNPQSPKYLLTFKGEPKYLKIFESSALSNMKLIASRDLGTYLYGKLCVDLNNLRWNL